MYVSMSCFSAHGESCSLFTLLFSTQSDIVEGIADLHDALGICANLHISLYVSMISGNMTI